MSESRVQGLSSVRGSEEERPRRRRLPSHEREQMILDEATRFFADNGFSAQTRDLAERLGISQGLIFRYFKTKEQLVERVYERTFLQRWRPDWEDVIADRTLPLEDRLRRFYLSYLRTIDDYVWVRIAMFSGLAGNDLTARYVRTHVEKLLRQIAIEVRIERGDAADRDIDRMELEQVWQLHSAIIYYLVRKYIFRTAVDLDHERLVGRLVHAFLHGSLDQADVRPV
ncbi:MAG: helix-turn-helix domain-containing protein [Pseudomonadota bacterium]